MSELSSKFTREDIQTLLDAVGDWENLGMGEWHVAKAVKDAPLPPEDHEAYEIAKAVKEHFRNRELVINDNRELRMEKAVFLKAKLLLVRKALNIDSLFEMPVDTSSPPPASKKEDSVVPQKSEYPQMALQVSDLTEKLRLAEFYIKDLGVQAMYEKFLAEKAAEKLEETKKE